MILPSELIDEIIYFCDVKTTILLQKLKIFSLTYDELKSRLTDKIGIDVSNRKLVDIKHISTLQYQIFLLTTIGKMYHTGFGLNDKQFYLEISKDKYNNELCEFVEDYGVDEDDNTAYFHDYMIKPLTNMIIPFYIIIIKHKENYWRVKNEREWYNTKSTWWHEDKFKDRLLPFLNTRPYIIVDDPYQQITISAEKKGRQLTIDDVLFATRALACDDTRRVVGDRGGYKIISVTNNILILEPCMDNYSS